MEMNGGQDDPVSLCSDLFSVNLIITLCEQIFVSHKQKLSSDVVQGSSSTQHHYFYESKPQMTTY